MDALILAGGSGSRLDLGEKSLVTIQGKPMIGYVIDAFRAAGCEVIVVLTKKTPFTRNWCTVHGIPHFIASGLGYIEDIRETAEFLDKRGPFFTCVADLPCLDQAVIREIGERYLASGKEACSVWVPRDLVLDAGCSPGYTREVCGVPACPVGINIIRGDLIAREQEEFQFLIQERSLVFNINTRDELEQLRMNFPCPGDQKKQ